MASSARLAYFHIEPVSGESPRVLADRAALITLTHGDEVYRDEVRAAGYDGLILQYVVAAEVNGPGPYRDASAACDATFEPLRNGIVRLAGNYGFHPSQSD